MALLLWGRSTEPFLEHVRRNRQDGEGQAFALALWKSGKDIPYKVPVQYVISAHSLPPHLASGALSLLLSAARLLCAALRLHEAES